jgi:hypothetical protein
MSIIKTISKRWKAETPVFFKQIQKLATGLGASAAAIWTAQSTMTLELHPVFLEVCKYLIVFSAAMGGTAQLTQVDPTKIENEISPIEEESKKSLTYKSNRTQLISEQLS